MLKEDSNSKTKEENEGKTVKSRKKNRTSHWAKRKAKGIWRNYT